MNRELMNAEEEISTAIKNLIRALTMQEFKNQLKWHKALYEIGKPAIPKICSTIKSYHCSNLDLRSKQICISGLMRLVHDIDETEASRLSDELIKGGCEPLISNHLKSINEFTSKNFRCYRIKGVNIFEERKVAPGYSIRLLLQKWFENVPPENLNEVDRIYVKSRDKQDYAGNYMPIFFSINLIWYAPSSRYNPLFWLLILLHERTFYHEIGHHVSRHTFGQDPEQEREADRYASRLMAKRHPILGAVINSIGKTIKKLEVSKTVRAVQKDGVT